MGKYTQRERVIQIVTDLVTVCLISGAFFFVFFLIDPYARGFYCNDESIRFPLKDDTVPLWLAGAYGAGAAFLIVIMAELYINRQCCADGGAEEFKLRQKRWILNTLNGCLLYSLGAMCTMLITEIGKRSIGRLRPHFIQVCQPDWEKIECFTQIDNVNVANYIYMTPEICTGDEHLIREARVSFPSGHSSFTTFSMVFVIIYLEARFNVNRARIVKTILQFSAFIAAWHTCMSRVSDFKHHHTDVIAGAVIGLSVALFITFITGKQIWDFNRIRSESKKRNIDMGQAVEYDSLDI